MKKSSKRISVKLHELTSNSGSLSKTGRLSLRTVPFQGRNLVPLSTASPLQMVRSAGGGLIPIAEGESTLTGPRHSSSGHSTKDSMSAVVCSIKSFFPAFKSLEWVATLSMAFAMYSCERTDGDVLTGRAHTSD